MKIARIKIIIIDRAIPTLIIKPKMVEINETPAIFKLFFGFRLEINSKTKAPMVGPIIKPEAPKKIKPKIDPNNAPKIPISDAPPNLAPNTPEK